MKTHLYKGMCAFALLITFLSGCTKEQPYPKNQMSYQLDDSCLAVMEIDEDAGMTQNGNNPFSIFNADGDIVAQGTFISAAEYDEYVALLMSQDGQNGLTILEKSQSAGLGEYVLYKYDSSGDAAQSDDATQFIEYDCISKIPNSNYGAMIGSTRNEEIARNVFSSLSITVEEVTEEGEE